MEKVDDKYITLRLADGTTFAYRATEKSQIKLKGKPDARAADLEPGMKVHAKGRTLATLDTWLVELSDTPFPTKATAEKPKPSAKPAALAASGRLEGSIVAHLAQYKMFDIDRDQTKLHITYTEATKFFLDGNAVKAASIQPRQRVAVTYTRDKYGRILASKVELFST